MRDTQHAEFFLKLAQLGGKTADLATKQRAESSVGESATSDRNQ